MESDLYLALNLITPLRNPIKTFIQPILPYCIFMATAQLNQRIIFPLVFCPYQAYVFWVNKTLQRWVVTMCTTLQSMQLICLFVGQTFVLCWPTCYFPV